MVCIFFRVSSGDGVGREAKDKPPAWGPPILTPTRNKLRRATSDMQQIFRTQAGTVTAALLAASPRCCHRVGGKFGFNSALGPKGRF